MARNYYNEEKLTSDSESDVSFFQNPDTDSNR